MMQQSRDWYIWSKTSLNTYHIVTRDHTGAFTCSCPDFQFRGQICKHIKKVKIRLAGEKQKNKLPGVEQ